MAFIVVANYDIGVFSILAKKEKLKKFGAIASLAIQRFRGVPVVGMPIKAPFYHPL
jgi:hypothetical protein